MNLKKNNSSYIVFQEQNYFWQSKLKKNMVQHLLNIRKNISEIEGHFYSLHIFFGTGTNMQDLLHKYDHSWAQYVCC